MAGQSGAPLVAVHLPRPEAARAVTAAWDRGDAVLVLDPAAPPAVVTSLMARLRPTHLTTAEGLRALPAGAEAAAGSAAVVVTSGTTGDPKGAELSVAGLEAIGGAFAATLGVEPGDRALVCLPLHHVAGLAILARARVSRMPVTVHPSFDLAAVSSAPRTEGVTVVSLVPTMLRRLLDVGAPLHEFRRVILGGAPTPPDLRARAEAEGAPIVDAYGLSETWGGVVLDGTPVPGAEVRIEDGEIQIRGEMVMRGYRLAPHATAAAFTSEAWFRTGDIGTLDDGRVRVIDRVRDIVISGGVNVSPTAVEAVLSTHPDVTDVCVTGTPDREWGERVVAFVVPRDDAHPTLDQLRAHAGDRLSTVQLPKQVVLVDAIPRTPGARPCAASCGCPSEQPSPAADARRGQRRPPPRRRELGLRDEVGRLPRDRRGRRRTVTHRVAPRQ
ncbi:MAG: fatty acid--CoA ligase family protein [Acidimicrobiia bacterium]